MIRRFTTDRLIKPAAGRRPAENRTVRFIVMALGAGVIAALLAMILALIPSLIVLAFPTAPVPEIQAGRLFPTPSPLHQVVNVYDPAPAAPRPAPTRPPTPRSSPPPQSPEPGDGGGGGGGGGD